MRAPRIVVRVPAYPTCPLMVVAWQEGRSAASAAPRPSLRIYRLFVLAADVAHGCYQADQADQDQPAGEEPPGVRHVDRDDVAAEPASGDEQEDQAEDQRDQVGPVLLHRSTSACPAVTTTLSRRLPP